MTRRLFSLLVALVPVVVAAPANASAPCRDVTSATIVQGQIQTKSVRRCDGETGSDTATSTVLTPTVGREACRALLAGLYAQLGEYCGVEPVEMVTPATVSAAFRRVSLPAARLEVQPPNGRTLVNFATNFYTEREEFTRNVRLLGQRVQLRITPAQFTWHFDDGKTVTTSTPGAPYPKLEITHDYLEKGGVSPRVDTTYTAVFRVDGGAWQPVPGSVTITGEPVALEIVEASPLLVGYN